MIKEYTTTIFVNRVYKDDIEVLVTCEAWYERGEKIETKVLCKGFYVAYLSHECKEFLGLKLTDEEKACAEQEILQKFFTVI